LKVLGAFDVLTGAPRRLWAAAQPDPEREPPREPLREPLALVQVSFSPVFDPQPADGPVATTSEVRYPRF
jgi:hypothetical protein